MLHGYVCCTFGDMILFKLNPPRLLWFKFHSIEGNPNHWWIHLRNIRHWASSSCTFFWRKIHIKIDQLNEEDTIKVEVRKREQCNFRKTRRHANLPRAQKKEKQTYR